MRMSLQLSRYPGDPVRKIPPQMAHHQYRSAVVLQGERVVGLFPTVHGLRALSKLPPPQS